ncbi:ras-related protein Rab-4B isoform X1 [Lutra lutra]|uniref:ras-related protein Rab-4B isoform X1 n=1 Tax=Lutra lutra TaxID=9657 RepID=UPI001FD3F9C5|nr:ras-related protein Rab-4B isoform X1 [Lutra lutra]XP_047567854.1 ras-related protein Rab-4B isoform X1 [Lutra lutra]XP_047567855.1 ras-related protein Rab-4B isoform X1 [Lutra lutra]
MSPPPSPLLPNPESRLCTGTPDQIRFSGRQGISVRSLPTSSANRSLGPSPFSPSLLAPPILAFCPACRPSSSPIPASGKRGLVSLSPSGSCRREVEAEVAAPAPGVGRSRGCSRSGAAASRGAGAAAAPYCGPKRPRPSHGRDLRQTGLQPHNRRGVWISGGQRGWKNCEAPDLGHSRPGAVSRGAISGQTPASGVTGFPWPHRSVTRSYYRGAAGALLVYDITSRETYNSLAAWLTDARTLASPNIVVILCGNKKDLDPEREVTFLEASRFAQENELMFLETSALTGENVEEAFLKCARTILNKIDSGELDPERMGSGIQYGDASLRQLRQPRSAQAVTPQPCGC